MSREIPKIPNDWKPPQPNEGHRYEIELITPMVGGGATAGKVDTDFPIRPTAIRGQLRHWWRLVCGYKLGEKMWRREEEIFGSTEFPSPVTVSVIKGTKAATIEPVRQDMATTKRGYILFPSIEKQQKNPNENYGLLKEGYQFEVRLSILTLEQLKERRKAQNLNRKQAEQLPEHIEAIDAEVQHAMNAWLLFGGLGGRTRRGCGSLRLFKQSMPSMNNLIKFMSEEFKVYQPKRSLPHISAWEQCLDLLKTFRQQPPARRGLSRKKFPEAETLRRISKPRGGRNPVIPEDKLPSGFPRAELGLPIVFQFQDKSGPDGATALPHGKDSQGKPLQRMASPVILKPIPVSEKESIPTLILINRPKDLMVDVLDKSQLPVNHAKFAGYTNSPLENTSGSALEAFIQFTGFTEVPRS